MTATPRLANNVWLWRHAAATTPPPVELSPQSAPVSGEKTKLEAVERRVGWVLRSR